MPQIVNKKSVLEMAMGAIAEITDYEVERVVANIMDPNTAATAKRKITITLTFAPDDYRQQIGMDAQAKTCLYARLRRMRRRKALIMPGTALNCTASADATRVNKAQAERTRDEA